MVANFAGLDAAVYHLAEYWRVLEELVALMALEESERNEVRDMFGL